MEKNREIKFRFWNQDKFMITDHKGWREDIGINEAIESSKNYGYKIMQYTGLHDKNNEDIYEGDILEFPFNAGIGFVVWYQTGWWIESPGSQARDREEASTISQCEIIGNIYETPELLTTPPITFKR